MKQSAAWSARLLATLLFLTSAPPAFAADEAANYQLTAATLQKIEAIDAEARRLGVDEKDADGADADEDADEEDADDIDSMVAKINSDPRRRALLDRHGIAPRELALSIEAMLHAGVYLSFEKSLDKSAAAKLYAGYTASQRANIELLRKRASIPR